MIHVVIVNFNAGAMLADAVASVIGDADRVVVVDNASSDASVESLERRFAGQPSLTVVRRATNGGFSVGCNDGLRALGWIEGRAARDGAPAGGAGHAAVGLEGDAVDAAADRLHALDGMAARGFGRIVNITSSSVKAPIDILGLSNGARSGLTGFVAGLARSGLAAQGVTINNLLPGAFDTDRLRATQAAAAAKLGKGVEEVAAGRRQAIPARRFGTAEEFGQVCAFLCSIGRLPDRSKRAARRRRLSRHVLSAGWRAAACVCNRPSLACALAARGDDDAADDHHKGQQVVELRRLTEQGGGEHRRKHR